MLGEAQLAVLRECDLSEFPLPWTDRPEQFAFPDIPDKEPICASHEHQPAITREGSGRGGFVIVPEFPHRLTGLCIPHLEGAIVASDCKLAPRQKRYGPQIEIFSLGAEIG